MPQSKIISGEMYYFVDEAYLALSTRVYLQDAIDKEILAEAYELTQKVHPYIAWTVEEKDGSFYYKDTNNKAVLYSGEKVPSLGSQELNGQLVSISYFDNVVEIHLFHGMLDGVAQKRILETLLYYYFCLRDKKEYNDSGIMTQNADEYKTLFAEPFEKKIAVNTAYQPEIPKEQVFHITDSFKNPEQKVLQYLRVSNDSFMKYVKENKMSPSVAFGLLICQAIQKCFPENKNPIRMAMPVNIRDAVNVPETFRNATADISLYYYPEKMKQISEMEQGAYFRAELKKQLTTDVQRTLANASIDFMSTTEQFTDYDSKASFYRKLPLPSSDTFLLSYIGKVQAGEYEQAILSFESRSIPREGIVFNIYDCNGCFHINMVKWGTDTKIRDALVLVCKEKDIHILESSSRTFELDYVSLRETLGLK